MTAHAATSGPVDPGEADGTGAGEREAHRAAEGAMDAAIEAAQSALDSVAAWPRPSGDRITAEAAVRAAEPILRKAVAEEIEKSINDLRMTLDYGELADMALERAAAIAREIGAKP